MGPITPFGDTEMLRKGNREFAFQTWWHRSLISVRPKSYKKETESLQGHLGETELVRVSGSGYVNELGGAE